MKVAQFGTDSVLLAPVAAATAARSANLDCAGGNYATIRVTLGEEASTNSTNVSISLSESDETEATTFTTFDSSFTRTVDNTAAVVATNHVDLEGRKRYIRLTVTPDTTTNGAVISSATGTIQKDVRNAGTDDLGDDVVIG